MSLGKLPQTSSRFLLPPLNCCDFSSLKVSSPSLNTNDTLSSMNSPRFKNDEFIRLNKRRITELVSPSDPFINKFEQMSKKLEIVIRRVHKKYSYESFNLKPSPRGNSIQFEESNSTRQDFPEVQKSSKKRQVKRPTLNKHVIRSQLFETTSKWLSPKSKK